MIETHVQRELSAARAALARAAGDFGLHVRVREEGTVIRSGDGVVSVSGLAAAASGEILEIGDGVLAQVLGLERDRVDAVVLGDVNAVGEGDPVRGTARVATIGVGPGVLGRVLDPMGRPLDGRPLIGRSQPMPLERPAPPIHARASVHRPLYTGTLMIDALFPIGRGQRELIIGDEGTGKTTIAVDALIRQARTELICVYVACGRRRAETWAVTEKLRSAGGRWVVISAPDDESPGLRYLAPYAGTAVAEYFVDRGEHALIVYDDLTAHAVAWRELSLLMRRPPGREAYPGDVFYLHSRLVERAAQLAPEAGGGSLTALPVAVTESGRLAAYIPTNLISMADGQIVLSSTLFAAGQKPAIDARLSVSRVGGHAQSPVFKELAGRLKLDYAAFLELEAFARIGTRLEEAAEQRLAKGRAMRALMTAPRDRPLGILDEVVRLVLMTDAELLTSVPLDAAGPVATDATATLRARHPGLVDELERDQVLGGDGRVVVSEALSGALAQTSRGR
jgi:F-type H+-transporting ATPase subunit alpha